MTQHHHTLYDSVLEERKKKGLYRVIQGDEGGHADTTGNITRGGRPCVNWGSNDYLAMSLDPFLIARAQEWAARWGVGSGASRLLGCHHQSLCHKVERAIAAGKGMEASLLFACGWMANVSVLSSLLRADVGMGQDVAIYTDRLNHESLHRGCQLAGVRERRYRHLDLNHLETLLSKDHVRYRYIVSETLFSMDGDCVDIQGLVELARKYHAFLYLDDAHAMGVFGKNGFGMTESVAGIDMVMTTFGKALGGFAASICCRHAMREYLINCCGGVIYSTALPPPLLGALDAGLERLVMLTARRKKLLDGAAVMRRRLRHAGYDCLSSQSHIIPIIVKGAFSVHNVARQLWERGHYVPFIRTPTVPKHQERLRISMTSAHTRDDMDGLFHALTQAYPL